MPAKDNTLFEISDHHVDVLSNGSGKYLFVGATVSHGIRRAILAFDLSIYNFLPGATVISTTLGLNHSSPGESTSTISLHKLVTDWGESASDAGEPGGDGAPASLGDATWLHSFYDDSFWNAEGGDFVQTASATQTVGIESVTFIWGSTQMMVEDVQGWIQNPGSNYGWILIGNEDVPGTAKRFDSRENTSANQPKLIVHYTYPTFTNCRYLPMVNK